MRLSATVALLLFLTGAFASRAQVPIGSESTKTDEIETLSQSWMTAAKDRDLKTLENLMAEDFRLVHPSQDKVTTRAQWLSSLSTLETRSFRYEHLKVDHYGKSLAVASAVFIVDAVMNGRAFTPVTSVIDVWEKRHGKWQIVTRYATRPEEIKPPKS